MPGSEAWAVIEDEKDEGWNWKRHFPSKLESLSEATYDQNKIQLNLFYQCPSKLDNEESLVDVTVQSDVDFEIVNEGETIKDIADWNLQKDATFPESDI
jgi:hypothetical protein